MKNKNNKDKTAVALSYDPSKDAAPKITATGRGILAEKILDVAKESQVPIHKDEVLVSTLSKLDLGEEIPKELYEVVSEILVFVDQMDRIKEKVAKELYA